MPEKVRRLKNKSRSSPRRRRLFFIALIVLIVIGGWLAAKKLLISGQKEPVQIKDRKTVAVICYETDCFSMNQSGIIFARTPQPSGNLIFRFDDQTGRATPDIGQEMISKAALAEVLFLRKEIKEGLDILITRAVVPERSFTDFDLYTSAGWAVRVSVKNNAPATIEILRRTLAELATSTLAALEYIDLRLAGRVYYKTK